MNSNLLNVVSCYSNPLQWDSRLRLTKEFEDRMLDSGVNLTMVECQLGDRPWQLDNPHVSYLRVRHQTLVWAKENLINLGVSSLTHANPNWAYLAWIDADVQFNHPRWAFETIQTLQQYPIIQPWDFCYDLGPRGPHQHMAVHKGFCYSYINGLLEDNRQYDLAHPGYAWAIRRRNWTELGGLIETGALGAGDRHMSFALIGCVLKQIAPGISDSYTAPLLAWQRRALKSINKHIGYQIGSIQHYFHGSKPNRQYWNRWQILVRNQFDPQMDLYRNEFGVLELSGNKPQLTADIEQYFRIRNEDANTF